MKLKIAVTALLLTATYMAGHSLAQTDAQPELRKELKVLEPMLGNWVFQGKLPAELSPTLQKRCEAEMHGGLVVERLFTKDEAGKDISISLTIWRWDAQKKKLIAVSFTHGSNHTEAEFAIDATNAAKPTLTCIQSKPGSPIATRQTVTILDRQTHNWKVEASAGKGPIVDGVWKKQ